MLQLINKHMTPNIPDYIYNFNWQALLINCFAATGEQGLSYE